MRTLLVTLGAIPLLLVGCNRKPATAPSQTAEAPKEAVALVGKEAVTFEAVRATAGQNGYNLNEKQGAELALRDTVNLELLANEAEKLGYTNDPAIRQFTKNMAVQKLVREKVDAELPKQARPADPEMKVYYERHKEEFTQPTLARAQLLFVLKRAGKEDATAEKKKQVEDALAAGIAFGDAVQKLSDDPSVQANGGVTNWIIKGQPAPQYPPAVVNAVFAAANLDQLQGPFESTQGFHWVKLVEKRDGKVSSFEEARGQIAQRLEREKRLDLYNAYVETVKRRVPVTLYPDRLESALANGRKEPGPPMGPVRIAK